MRRSSGRTIGVVIACLVAVHSEGGGSPNFVPELTLSYSDPDSGERFECGGDCRRFTVPAGTLLEARVQIHEEGGGSEVDEATWDLWINQPDHPFPGLGLVPCYEPASEGLERSCWKALHDQVDREGWDVLVPDAVCVPGPAGESCRDNVVRVIMDPDFEGARRPGMYHFAVWTNRFGVVPEADEFDNFAGPIRVTVEPGSGEARESEQVGALASEPVVVPSSPMPYGVAIVSEDVDTGFTVTSMRSQRLFEFSPAYAGNVSVKVVQTGVYENMVVQVRKVSTGEVKIEARGKGRLRLQGAVDNFDLRDDRAFEVVVTPGQGSRGIRGSVRVSYPARLKYMVDP